MFSKLKSKRIYFRLQSTKVKDIVLLYWIRNFPFIITLEFFLYLSLLFVKSFKTDILKIGFRLKY